MIAGSDASVKAVQLTARVFELNIRYCDVFVQDISTIPHSLQLVRHRP
jgi:hypothetical protein